MLRSSFIHVASLLTLQLVGCGFGSAQEEVLTLEVAPYTVECMGEAVQRCLQVRREGETEWTNFYDRIEGFTHEEGYRYRIEVARRSRASTPADASSFEYRLLRVLSREAVEPPEGSP